RVKGLETGDHLGHRFDSVFGGVDEFAVVSIPEIRDSSRGAQVAAVGQTDGEGLESAPSRRTAASGARSENARIDAAGQQHTDRLLTVHGPFDGSDERLADGVEDPLRRLLVRGAALQQNG